MLQAVVNGCFSFRNVKVYKIIKIFCFFLWRLQNMLYICAIIIKQIESMTDLQIKQSIEISEKIERKCKLTAVKGKYGMQYTHNIVEETVLNLLRTLWVKTSNKFVKDVVKTVGVSKKISDKQLEIIANELTLLSITF